MRLRTYTVKFFVEVGFEDDGKPILKQVGTAVDIRASGRDQAKKMVKKMAEDRGLPVRAVSHLKDNGINVYSSEPPQRASAPDGVIQTAFKRPKRRARP